MDEGKINKQLTSLLNESCPKSEAGSDSTRLIDKIISFALERKEIIKRIPLIGDIAKRLYHKILLKLYTRRENL